MAAYGPSMIDNGRRERDKWPPGNIALCSRGVDWPPVIREGRHKARNYIQTCLKETHTNQIIIMKGWVSCRGMMETLSSFYSLSRQPKPPLKGKLDPGPVDLLSNATISPLTDNAPLRKFKRNFIRQQLQKLLLWPLSLKF